MRVDCSPRRCQYHWLDRSKEEAGPAPGDDAHARSLRPRARLARLRPWPARLVSAVPSWKKEGSCRCGHYMGLVPDPDWWPAGLQPLQRKRIMHAFQKKREKNHACFFKKREKRIVHACLWRCGSTAEGLCVLPLSLHSRLLPMGIYGVILLFGFDNSTHGSNITGTLCSLFASEMISLCVCANNKMNMKYKEFSSHSIATRIDVHYVKTPH